MCLNSFQIIETEINPYVDEWEEAGAFPAHKVFKTLGDAGFLGINKPTGKLKLLVMIFTMGKLIMHINCIS